jgi:hypothetical protein
MYGSGNDDSIEGLIQKEKAILLYNDAVNYPHIEQEPLPNNLYSMEKLDTYLEQASELIRQEFEALELSAASIFSFPVYGIDFDFDATTGEPIELRKMTKAHYKAHHKELYETMKLQAMASQKQEKKLQVILGGYMMRRTGLEKTFTETLEKIESLRIDYSVFSNLAAKERELIQARLADESKELQRISLIEMDLQDRFRDLTYERDRISR